MIDIQFYLYKTPLMNRRRALMVFSGAFEFKRENNKEIKDRETDSEELPKLMKEIEEHERNIAKPPTDQVLVIRYESWYKLFLAIFVPIFDESASFVFCSFV